MASTCTSFRQSTGPMAAARASSARVGAVHKVACHSKFQEVHGSSEQFWSAGWAEGVKRQRALQTTSNTKSFNRHVDKDVPVRGHSYTPRSKDLVHRDPCSLNIAVNCRIWHGIQPPRGPYPGHWHKRYGQDHGAARQSPIGRAQRVSTTYADPDHLSCLAWT